MVKKLGVIVPYRNRETHLEAFKKKMSQYLNARKIPFEIIIVHQDDAKLFNRGMLLNIGFKIAENLNCDYVVFHDVDMIPLRVDYEYSETPIHLATDFKVPEGESGKEIFDEYFGGVTMFPMDDFRKINGFSNKYWGWGYEDTDLLYRCVKNKIKLDSLKIKNQYSNKQKIKFNGVNSYVKGKNTLNFKKPVSIFISFMPSEIICDFEKLADDYNIFTIPGYDFSISFNSYLRYNICLFNKEHKAIYVNSKITKNYYTNIAITIDEPNQKIKVYQDGQLLDTIENFGEIYDYSSQEHFYIGMGNPLSDYSLKHFKGLFDKILIFDGILNENEIKNITLDKYDNINLEKLLWYDTRVIKNYKFSDLSNNKNDGEIHNCEIVADSIEKYQEVKIPYRRESTFGCLPHEENGFVNNSWKDQSIRWNQLRFINEVSKNDNLIYNDGLSTLEYTEHGRTSKNNITHINVGI